MWHIEGGATWWLASHRLVQRIACVGSLARFQRVARALCGLRRLGGALVLGLPSATHQVKPMTQSLMRQ